jgi:hypothetical protein
MHGRPITQRKRGTLAFAGSVLALVISTATVPGAWASGTTPPGNLPQTPAEPSFGLGLTAQMRVLWRAIATDSASLGQSAFFPRGAYLQMKTGSIPNPSNDYADRLIGLFDLDIDAYHRVLASGASVSFVRVEVSPRDAAWIPTGVCENKIGYWHLPGVRLVFRSRGKVESFKVDSLISWRGIWYVVHLGPNPRPTNVGTVDGLTSGPGVPGPAGGC